MISLRLNRFETKQLAWALALSLAAHFLAWGGYEIGKKTGLWQRLHWPARTHLAEKEITPPVQDSDPTIYLDVDPESGDAGSAERHEVLFPAKIPAPPRPKPAPTRINQS